MATFGAIPGFARPGQATPGSPGATPGPPGVTVLNQWANSYGQGATFTSITSALQSCVVQLDAGSSVGGGSGVPTAGNWLFTIACWTQAPAIANVRTGVSDDIRSLWREFPAAGSGGNTRTAISYTPNLARVPTCVYVAPDMEIAAITVLVLEVGGLGPWDTVAGMVTGYAAASTSLPLALGAPGANSFFLAAGGGDNISAGQALSGTGWTGLATVSQTDGSDHLADSYLTAAFLASSAASQSVSVTASSAEDLSGFAIAVYTTGLNPIPAGQNPAWPWMVFEAGFGSGFNTPDSEITWTDLSSRLWEWDETTGIQFQLGQIQATDLTITLDNYDNALSSTNTASPYYPNVQPGTPLRLRAALGTLGGVVTNRWYVIQRNAARWDEQIDEAFRRYVEVTATDLWAAMSSTPPTFYRSEVYEDAPYAWWPCDDQPGNAGVQPAALLNAALGNTNTLNVTISPNGTGPTPWYDTAGAALAYQHGVDAPTSGLAAYTAGADGGWMFGDPQGQPASLGTGNPVTSLPGSAAWQTTGQLGNTGSQGWFLSCHDTGFPPLSGGVTVEGWFRWPFLGSTVITNQAPGNRIIAQQPYCPLTLLTLATATAPVCVLQMSTAGHLNLITYNGASGTSHSIYTASDLRDNARHMYAVTLTQTTWTVWVDGGVTAKVSGTATGMTSAWTYLIANGDMGASGGGSPASIVHSGNVSVSHIAVYPYILPFYRIMDHYWAAVTAFGQLPAPSSVTVQPVKAAVSGAATETVTPDGQIMQESGGYGSGVSAYSFWTMSVVAVAQAGSVTSGPSAWSVTGEYPISTAFSLADNAYVSLTGVAPSFAIYNATEVGAETQAAVTAGNSDVFQSGYGSGTTSFGIGHTATGSGASPPVTPSAIGDTVGQRIERLMRAGRVTSPNRSIDPASLLVQAPGTSGGGTQVGAAIEAIQQSDSGMLFVDNLDNLVYWQRSHLASQYTNPVWQLGPDSGKIPYYREIKQITDPQRIFNTIAVTPLSPTGAALPTITPSNATAVDASQNAFGAQPMAITSWLQDQTKLQLQANWIFANFGTPFRRAENVKIDAAPYPAAWVLIVGVGVSDVVTLADWQIGGGGTVGTYRVTELTRRFTRNSHDSGVTGHVILTVDREPASYWT